MYWPLNAPRIYSAKGSKRRKLHEVKEDDSEDNVDCDDRLILGLRVSRSGHLFTTITTSSLNIWQTSPVVLLASVTRSFQSIKSYGTNISVLLRPDSSIAVVQTSLGFLVTYSISVDPQARVYQQYRQTGQSRRQSNHGLSSTEEERAGLPEVNTRFRMVIKVDAGIGKVLALDEELIVATEKPAAVQCIKWTPDSTGHQTSTELLSKMPWINKKTCVVEMVFDRAMSLLIWITNDGRAYAVQRVVELPKDPDTPKRLFRGYGFHDGVDSGSMARKAAINARFSLLAVGCANGHIHVYTARDYVGSISLSHKLSPPASLSSTGAITSLAYSPDGYCLFVGYERGWMMWSVYGKLGGSSFAADRTISSENAEGWLTGVQDSSWLSGGSEILMTSMKDKRIWIMETAKSAVTGCFCAANISRMLLQTNSTLLVYRGHDLPDLDSISTDASIWQQVQVPGEYLANQRPIRCAVISSDGRYIAVAGRRGLAHYSITSGRWKTFDDPGAENSFVVRGGMCWHAHILVAAVETDSHYELRLYSRELGLNDSSLVFVERLPAPAVVISPTGEDSVLVYTYENVLYHYVINAPNSTIQLVQVGQIGLHGIVRAPTRVRAVSWIIPDHQLRNGDPSQDVMLASVIFLVDAKLAVLQPTKDENGLLKYDMRVVANDVEYFALMRDQNTSLNSPEQSHPSSPSAENGVNGAAAHAAQDGLKDSLWFFDGKRMQCWTDIQDVLKTASVESGADPPPLIAIPADFYPTSVVLRKGTVLGIESELVQRRDVNFALFKFSTRTQLFIPPILRHHLASYNSPAALSLSYQYQNLAYFSHALEILLHSVLDDEVDSPPSPEHALLPSILFFLSSFPEYLDILVQCTRKTEVRSWRTLFTYLPPPQELFEQSLQKGLLKTAGGYLLVLHTFEELDNSSQQCVRLLQKAKEAGDWELCKELARFLMALDRSGDVLREAMEKIDIESLRATKKKGSTSTNAAWLKTPRRQDLASSTETSRTVGDGGSPQSVITSEGGSENERDYFSLQDP